MPEWLSFTAGFLALVCAAIAWAIYSSVRKLEEPASLIEPVTESDHPEAWRRAREREGWARRMGYEWLGGFRVREPAAMFLGAWKRSGKPEYFVEYVHPRGSHQDLLTVFSETEGLTTGSSRDGGLFPTPPGSFMQLFPGRSLDELQDLHNEAESYLRARLSFGRKVVETEFVALLSGAVERQMQHVRRHPLYPLWGPYWYFVRRNRVKNRRVEDLYASEIERRMAGQAGQAA